MAGGYTVGIASETKAFKQGIESGVIDPLEDAQKELLELGKSRGPEQLERAMKDAEKATERLKDETKDTADAIERDFRDSYRSVKRSSDDGMRGAKEGMEDFKQEANQTARESAASFDGSAESIVDVFQEIAANAFGGFGPAGAVAGLAAAAGIGLAMAGFEDVQQAEEESKQRAGEWAQAYVEAGGKVLNAATTTAVGLDIATDPDRFTQAKDNAKNWGVDVSVAIAAMAGETWALKAANDSLVETEKQIQEEMANTGIQNQELVDNLTDVTVAASQGRTELDKITGEMQRGGEQADAYSRYLKSVADNTAGATTKVDEFGDSVTSLPDGTTIYVDAETGQATTDLDLIEKKAYGVPDAVVNARVTGQNQVRVDLDALTRPRTVTVTAKLNAAFAKTMGWDQ